MSDILTRVKNHWDETGFHDAVHVTSSSCHCSSKGHSYKGGWDPLPQCHDADFSGFQVYFWTMFRVMFLLLLFWLFSCCNLILTMHKIIVTNQRIKSNLKYKSCFSFFLFNLETLSFHRVSWGFEYKAPVFLNVVISPCCCYSCIFPLLEFPQRKRLLFWSESSSINPFINLFFFCIFPIQYELTVYECLHNKRLKVTTQYLHLTLSPSLSVVLSLLTSYIENQASLENITEVDLIFYRELKNL